MQIKLIANPQYTVNLFDTLESVVGRWLYVAERNPRGDCLCLVDSAYLLDVDSRDVAETQEDASPQLSDITCALIQWLEVMQMRESEGEKQTP